MKSKTITLFFLFTVFTNLLFSQTGTGNSLLVSIKKKKPVIVWKNPITNIDTINRLTMHVTAEITCEDNLQSVELFINGSLQRGFIPIKINETKHAILDKIITLKEGQNTLSIEAKTAKESVSSETKTIIAHKSINKPIIRWISPNNMESTQEIPVVQIKACIESALPLNSIEMNVNGIHINDINLVENKDMDCEAIIEKKINLKNGENKIYITASNENGSNTSEILSILYNNNIQISKRIALVIGNSEYQNGGSLKNPGNDASDMAAVLKRLNFTVDLVLDADYKKMGMAVDRFGTRIKNADISFFYYAGHGVQVKGNNYLIPTDADIKEENQVKYNCLDANQVLAYMESAESKVNIIIMDACRDNPFERSWKRSIKGQGLASMQAPVGSIVAYSTQPGNTAADGTGKNGLYTEALLEYIESPDLSLLEIFMKVRIKVLKDSEKQQQPWESNSLTQNIYLLK